MLGSLERSVLKDIRVIKCKGHKDSIQCPKKDSCYRYLRKKENPQSYVLRVKFEIVQGRFDCVDYWRVSK